MSEKFDFSKQEDQEKFAALPKGEQDGIVASAREDSIENSKIEKQLDDAFSQGGSGQAKRFIKETGPPEEVISRGTTKALVSRLSQGLFGDAIEIITVLKVPEDILHSEPVLAAIEKSLPLYLSGGFHYGIAQNIDVLKVPENILHSRPVLVAIEKSLAFYISRKNFDEAKDIFDKLKIPEEVFHSRLVFVAVENVLHESLLMGKFAFAKEIINTFYFPEEASFRAVQTALGECLAREDISGAQNIIEAFKLPEVAIVTEAEKYIDNLQDVSDYVQRKNSLSNFHKIMLSIGLSENIILEMVKKVMIKQMSNDNPEYGYDIFDSFEEISDEVLKQENVLSATKSGMISAFRMGKTMLVENMFDCMFVSRDFVKDNNEVRVAAREAIRDDLIELNLPNAKRVIELAQLQNEDIGKATNEFWSEVDWFKRIAAFTIFPTDFFPDSIEDVAVLKTLAKLQAPSQNTENDPWRQELIPLLQSIEVRIDLPILEMVVGFVKEFGMINAPLLFDLFIGIQVGNLSEKDKETLTGFNIDPTLPSGQILAKLREVTKRYNKDLLEGRTPEELQTSLGAELFACKFLKSTQWDKGISIERWYELGARAEETYILPEGLKGIEKFEARERIGSKDIKKDAAEEINKVLASKDLLDRFSSIVRAIKDWIKGKDKTNELVFSLEQKILSIERELNIDQSGWVEYLTSFSSEDERKTAERRLKAMANPKARAGFEHTFQKTKQLLEKLKMAKEQAGQNGINSPEIISLLELLAEISDENAKVALRFEVFRHILEINPCVFDTFKQFELGEPTIDSVAILADFIDQQMIEHYLNEKESHSGHGAFSKKLTDTITQLFGATKEEKGNTAMRNYANSLRRLSHGEVMEYKTMPISLIPVSGLARLTSGYIGDACHTSQITEMSEGAYADTHAFLYATEDMYGNYNLRGSVFGICAETDPYEEPSFIVRANNPRENFIQTVDSDNFTENSLHAMINYAVKLREENIKNGNGGVMKVLAPLDNASQSSTNRPDVANFYHKSFNTGTSNKELLDTPSTNFNGYPIWAAETEHTCFVIWECDDKGKETYLGKWGNKPLHKLSIASQQKGNTTPYLRDTHRPENVDVDE